MVGIQFDYFISEIQGGYMLNRIPRSLVQILLLGVLVLPVGCGMNLTWGEFCLLRGHMGNATVPVLNDAVSS